ncbi:hypothetical protein D9758_005702 [Tetrapyrgos nigripes]|uniref:Uncharacterized protein n=1 Tax=Tetrapyrgos nigripes TaxID=182062 RepID=A0A8H5LR04_9AGAR|nr:hypothetical protein D9758_005702 [Tetrapyrgos nigripes]
MPHSSGYRPRRRLGRPLRRRFSRRSAESTNNAQYIRSRCLEVGSDKRRLYIRVGEETTTASRGKLLSVPPVVSSLHVNQSSSVIPRNVHVTSDGPVFDHSDHLKVKCAMDCTDIVNINARDLHLAQNFSRSQGRSRDAAQVDQADSDGAGEAGLGPGPGPGKPVSPTKRMGQMAVVTIEICAGVNSTAQQQNFSSEVLKFCLINRGCVACFQPSFPSLSRIPVPLVLCLIVMSGVNQHNGAPDPL